jgi:hypothetical protein
LGSVALTLDPGLDPVLVELGSRPGLPGARASGAQYIKWHTTGEARSVLTSTTGCAGNTGLLQPVGAHAPPDRPREGPAPAGPASWTRHRFQRRAREVVATCTPRRVGTPLRMAWDRVRLLRLLGSGSRGTASIEPCRNPMCASYARKAGETAVERRRDRDFGQLLKLSRGAAQSALQRMRARPARVETGPNPRRDAPSPRRDRSRVAIG